MRKQFTVKFEKIITTCDSMLMGQIYKALYLIAFFSFLRISKLVPHKIASFSPLEQLIKGGCEDANHRVSQNFKASTPLEFTTVFSSMSQKFAITNSRRSIHSTTSFPTRGQARIQTLISEV